MDNFKNIALITCFSSLPIVGYLWYINSIHYNEFDNSDIINSEEINPNSLNSIDDKKDNSKRERFIKLKSKKKRITRSGQTRKK